MQPKTLKTRGLHAAIRFAPAAVLDKPHKQQFQIKANEGFDWQRQEYTEKTWRLTTPQSEGDPRSNLKLTVQPDAVNFEDAFPTGPPELFFDNLKMAMDVISTVFSPKIILASGVVVRMAAESEHEDARRYLSTHCLNLDDRLGPLGRPVEGLGLRLFLPPLAGEGQPNWRAAVKVENLLEDPRQLYIEVDASWGNPIPWNARAMTDRVKTVHEFAGNQVAAFLQELGRSGPPG